MELPENDRFEIGIVGAGTMGAGIAELAARFGHKVKVWDVSDEGIAKSFSKLHANLARAVETGKIEADKAALISTNIEACRRLEELSGCHLIIEAISEKLEAKRELFAALERIASADAILATNTSSLSVCAIASACKSSQRVLGLHFFNPPLLMPLVEIVAGLDTKQETVIKTRSLVEGWGKSVVQAKDTPGFIVNRIARPFYGESLKMLEEGIADAATIDWALKTAGGFRMGPFELMDMIGNDVNFAVTSTVFAEFFYDPRYRPSITQKRMVDAGRLGRKSGKGYYDYTHGSVKPEHRQDEQLASEIFQRVLAMLINEAAEALFLRIATAADIELAMTRGVNYPRGLLAWGNEIGLPRVLEILNLLQETYGDDRYRASVLLKRLVAEDRLFE